jgi:thiol-disulfide isomerase/thioredoxin
MNRAWQVLSLAMVAVVLSGQSTRPEDAKEKARAARLALVGKPLEIKGQMLDGQEFSTAQWKGKVVLVHFWASWCPDCRKELPSVIAAYQKLHAQGLEMLGISSDRSADALKAYVKEHPEIAWTQVYATPAENGRHPLNNTYSVDWIPTLFVIDKKGVCRSIDGDKELAEVTAKLLAEKD